MLRQRAFRLLALVAISGSAAAAQTRGPFDEVYVTNIRADPARCNLGRARRVAFDALLRNHQSPHSCVAVRGVWGPGGLYRNAADARAAAGADVADVPVSRIGLYGRREIMDLSYARTRVEITAVGTVGDCATWTEMQVNVTGFCGSFLEGPYIALAEMYLEP